MKLTLLMLSVVTFIVPCDGASAVRRLAPVAGRVACAAAAARPGTGFDVCGRRMVSGDAADEQARFMKYLKSLPGSGSGVVSVDGGIRVYRAISGNGHFPVGLVAGLTGMGSLGLEAIQTLDSHVYITDLPLVLGLSLTGLGLRIMYKESKITGWKSICTLTSDGLGIGPWDESDKSGEEGVGEMVIPWPRIESCSLTSAGQLVVAGEFGRALLRIDPRSLSATTISTEELEAIIKQFMKMAAEASAGSGDTEMEPVA